MRAGAVVIRPRPLPGGRPTHGIEWVRMTTKERLRELVEKLTEQEADDVLRYITGHREDPMIAAFRDAPDDDEPFTAADEEALAEVRGDRASSVPRISSAEIKRKYGSA